LPEREPNDGPGGFPAVPLTPERAAHPVPYFGRGVRIVEVVQADPADDLAVGATHDLQRQPHTGPQTETGPPDVGAGVPRPVRYRDVQGPACDARFGEQLDQLPSMGERREDQLQPRGTDRKSGLPYSPGKNGTSRRHDEPLRGRSWRGRGFRKLRYIREAVGCEETFRYFAERLAE